MTKHTKMNLSTYIKIAAYSTAATAFGLYSFYRYSLASGEIMIPHGKVDKDGNFIMSDSDKKESLKLGFFQVKFEQDYSAIRDFSKNWFSQSKYTYEVNKIPHMSNNAIQGYMVDMQKPLNESKVLGQINQVERLAVKNPYWDYFPEQVTIEAQRLHESSKNILNAFLEFLEVPRNQDITGGIFEGKGNINVLLNRYNPDSNATLGLKAHKDYGWITALITPIWKDENIDHESSNLEVKVDGEYKSVKTEPDTLIFNIGASFERTLKLFASSKGLELNAPEHRVLHCENERYSVAMFNDPAYDSDTYLVDETGEIHTSIAYKDLVAELNNALYE